MKAICILITTALLVTACRNPQNTPAQQDTAAKVQPVKEKLTVADSSQYSKGFLDSLRARPWDEPIQLTGNYMIIGKDTTAFPELKLNKLYIFKASADSATYTLEVKRPNVTDITFTYTAVLKDSLLYKETSTATLNAFFFLGAESTDDSESGDSYWVYEYLNNTNGCVGSVLIGIEPDDKGRFPAQIKYACDKQKPLKGTNLTLW